MPKQEQFDKAYLLMAETWGQLSKAERKKVGCLVVKDGQIISDGYNGTPAGYSNVCEIENVTKPEVLHAESNALMKLAKSTNSSRGSTIYLTTSPCFECSKLMIQAEIKRLVYGEEYRKKDGIKFLNENNIETCFFPINWATEPAKPMASETYVKLSKTPKHPEWLV